MLLSFVVFDLEVATYDSSELECVAMICFVV